MPTREAWLHDLTISEVTAEKLNDFRALMIHKNCWCMYWRLSERDFGTLSGNQRREKMEHTVNSGIVPGILAFLDKKPIAWCSIAPRDHFQRFPNSTKSRPLDEGTVWSITCFYIDRRFRGKGVTSVLIKGAVDYAAKNGANIVEAYPMNVEGKYPYPSAAFTGFLPVFIEAGFVEGFRRSEKRVVVRYTISAQTL